jgi:hypothetical protein
MPDKMLNKVFYGVVRQFADIIMHNQEKTGRHSFLFQIVLYTGVAPMTMFCGVPWAFFNRTIAKMIIHIFYSCSNHKTCTSHFKAF